MCTSFEFKMAAENTMFLQERINNDMLQGLLVASQQQQHFDIQQFEGMCTQQNIQQSELQKDPDNEDLEGDQKCDRESDEEEVCQIFLA